MQQSSHPDDERLAALAASEPDALADSPLVTHVSACPRCAPIVDDLRMLQSALAELPDVPPSRPLRFLPAVPDPVRPESRWVGLLRGITGPAMAVAMLLVVVGAFGTAFGNGFGFTSSAGAAPAAASLGNVDARSLGGASATPTSDGGKAVSGQPARTGSPVPVAAGSSASANAGESSVASATASNNDRLQATHGSRTSTGGIGEGEPGRPPFGLMLGFGVVLLAAAFVARGYLRGRSLA